MKKFYCVTDGSRSTRELHNYTLLKNACEQRGIDFIELSPPEGAWSYDEIPNLEIGGLYRLKISPRYSQYASALLAKNPHLRTFTVNNQSIPGNVPWKSSILADENGIAIIPSLYGMTDSVDDSLLQKINTYLGGFPVVIKKTGGSHGSGVMIVDTPEALKTVAAHIIGEGKSAEYTLKKFIVNASHYRLIVLGDQVISTIKYLPQAGDIRTNAVAQPKVEPAKLSPELEALAVKATHNENTVFAGVDLLVDDEGTAYVAEANSPCNFSRNQNLTGDDIAGSIVEYLTEGDE